MVTARVPILDSSDKVPAALLNTPVFDARAYGGFSTPSATVTTIQAAINDCSTSGGGIVFIAPGTYSLNGPLTAKSNVRLTGAGPATVLSSTVDGNLIVSGSGTLTDFAVEDMKFLGPVSNTVTVPTRNRTTSGAGTETAISIDGDLDTATPGTGTITNIAVRRVVVQNTTSLPIRLFGIRGEVSVTGCRFVNTMDVGFGFCEQVICSDNTSLMSQDNGYSISRGCKKVTVTGNTVENACYHGIWLSGFSGSAGPEDFACTGNTVRGCGRSGIALIEMPTYGTVTGNTIDKGGYRGNVEGPEDEYGVGVFVRGQDSNTTTPTTLTRGVLIADNTIRNAPRAGICLNGATGLKVTGNLLVDCGSQFLADGTTSVASSAITSNVGVLLENPATVTNTTITGNDTIDTRSTPYCNWGVQPTSAATVSMSGNRMIGCRNTSNLPPPVRSDVLSLIAAGAETLPRWAATNMASVTLPSGVIRFGYFTAARTTSVTQISVSSGSVAAGPTPTLVRYGLYSVSSAGDLTQMSATTSDTSLFSDTATAYPKTLGSAQTLVEGARYAIGVIVVTAAAAPTVTGVLAATGQDNGRSPRLCGSLSGQTDLASSYLWSALSDSQALLYAAAY